MTLWTDPALKKALLVDPLNEGCNELRALSGYASPSVLYALFAEDRTHHLAKVQLTVGMVGVDGISLGAHHGFLALQNVDYPGRVDVRYVTDGKGVHSKVYVWCKDGYPNRAFVGSANFTSNGIEGGYREVLTGADPARCLALVDEVAANAQPCDDPQMPGELIMLHTSRQKIHGNAVPQYRPWERDGVEYRDISLLTPRSQTGVAYGLNWGHRAGRDLDQSYLPVPAIVARSIFLPPRGHRFTLLASDGRALSAVVAQDGDKAIETPDSNAILGRFIRSQLGLPHGALIRPDDLRRANATGYRLYRIDSETFAIEFRPVA